MSRTAAFWVALVISLGTLAVAALVRTPAVLVVAAFCLGVTSFVFAHELSERRPYAYDELPDSRGARVVILKICGAILAIGAIVMGVAAAA